MATYDISDQNLQFQYLKKQREDMEQEKAERQKYAADLGSSAWKMYSAQQQADQASDLAQRVSGSPIFQESQQYADKNFLGKMLTPAGGRVELTQHGKDLQSVGDFMQTKDIGDLGSANITDIVGAQSEALKRGTDLKGITGLAQTGPKTMGQSFKNLLGGAEGSQWSKMGGLGKGLGALGLLTGGVGLAKNWDKMSAKEKLGGLGGLGLGAASMFIPGLQPLGLMAGLGKKLFSWFK